MTILDRDTPVARIVPEQGAAVLTVRHPIGDGKLHAVRLPAPLRLDVDPVEVLLEERQADR